MLKKCAEYVMSNRLHAVIVVLLASLVPPLAWIGTIVMALATLRLGALEGLLLVLCLCLPDLVQFVNNHDAVYLLNICFSTGLVWFLAVFLRQWRSWALTLQFAAFLGIVTVIIIHSIFPNVNLWWRHELTEGLRQFTHDYGIIVTANKQKVLTSLSFLATGLLTAKIIFTNILQLLFARLLQDMLYNPGGLRNELKELRLHYGIVVAFAVCLIASFAHSLIAVDVLPVLLLPFFLVGLYLVHRVLENRKHLVFWLILIYALLLVCFPYIASALVLLGLIDSCYDVRQRIRLKS